MLGLALIGVVVVTNVAARLAMARLQAGDSGLRVSTRTLRGWAGVAAAGLLAAWLLVLAEIALGHHGSPSAQVVGAVLTLAGIALVAWAQVAMGASWRIGLDPDEHTELVRGGPFRVVRNPIYSGMTVTLLGLGVVTGSLVSLAAVAVMVAGLEVQTRLVEEPYLRRMHPDCESYRTHVGRFVPVRDRLA